MVTPSPDFDSLLPPFLAQLPASLTSSEPPQALYPLLIPLLRSRLQLLSEPGSAPWLSLLTWTSSRGPELVSHLAEQDLSPLSLSGGADIGHLRFNGVQRLDAETLKASVELLRWGIAIIYEWAEATKDEAAGWRIIDVHTAASGMGEDDGPEWKSSVTAAEEAWRRGSLPCVHHAEYAAPAASEDMIVEEDGEDDDYWNMYDRTANQTPSRRPEEEPSEEEYFSRFYGDREGEGEGENDKSEEGDTPRYRRKSFGQSQDSQSPSSATSVSTPPSSYNVPRPVPSESATLRKLEQLEQAAASKAHSEVAIKQHISTTMKSLYRLSKAGGMTREDFESIIQTEVAVLSMLDEEED